jgi:hypothetical protein
MWCKDLQSGVWSPELQKLHDELDESLHEVQELPLELVKQICTMELPQRLNCGDDFECPTDYIVGVRNNYEKQEPFEEIWTLLMFAKEVHSLDNFCSIVLTRPEYRIVIVTFQDVPLIVPQFYEDDWFCTTDPTEMRTVISNCVDELIGE